MRLRSNDISKGFHNVEQVWIEENEYPKQYQNMIFSPWMWKLGTTSKTIGVGCTVLLGGHVAVVLADIYSKIKAVFDDNPTK